MQRWCEEMGWDEIAQMSKIEFSFSDEVKPQPYTQKVASALNDLSIVPNATAKQSSLVHFFWMTLNKTTLIRCLRK